MSFLKDIRRRFAALGSDDLTRPPVAPEPLGPGAGRMREPALDRPDQTGDLSEPAWRSWLALSGLFAWETDAYGRFTRIGADAFGWRAEDLLGQHALELAPEPERSAARLVFTAQAPVQGVEFWLRRRDGMLAIVSAAAFPLTAPDGARLGARGVCRDISEERAGLQALADARRRESAVASVIRSMHDAIEPAEMLPAAAASLAQALGASGVAIYRHDGERFHQRARFGAVLETASVLQMLSRLANDPSLVIAEIAARRALAVGSIYRGEVNGAIVAWRQPMEPAWTNLDRELAAETAVQIGIAIAQMRHNDELQRISSTDALTGLLNRRMFFEQLKSGLNRADGRNRHASMGYVDLDYFKAVNDVHGHQKGDLALQRVGDLLRANTKPEDLIARLGGDEFAVFLADCDEAAANVWGAQMLEAAKALLPLSGAPDKPLGLSVGLVVYDPRTGETADQLTQRADEAMYSAKRAGKGRVRVGRRE